MFGVLPLLFALLIAHNARGHDDPTLALLGLEGAAATAIGMLASTFLWWLVNLLVVRLWQRASEAGARLWDHTATLGALLLFAAWCRYLGWADSSAWSFVHLLPFLVLIVIAWRASALLASHGHRRSATHAVSNRVRFGLVPVLVAILLFDLIQLYLLEPLLDQVGDDDSLVASVIVILAVITMPVVVLSLLPPIVVRLWRARPMPPGPERDLLAEGCRQAGVKVRSIWHWPAAGGRFYNAAVMGLLPQTRYVLFSDDLLRDLPSEQLLAVLGHELGHIQHRHLPLYLLYLLAGTMWVAVATEPLRLVFMDLGLGDAQIAGGLAMILLFILVLRVGFGMVSRTCERQADLAGARLAGDPRAMQAALRNVAALSGQDPEAPSWRHHSIAERIAYLAAVEQDPRHAADHHRKVRMLGWTIIAILVLIPLFGMQLLRPSAPGDEWLEEHPVAAAGYQQALDGDAGTLEDWLAEAPLEDRRAFALLVLDRTSGEGDIRTIYPKRHLMLPFVGIDIGDPRLSAAIVNNGVYAAIGGTGQPDPAEVETAWKALPELRAAAFEEESPVYHDTVGCIYFVNQERLHARDHFESAIELLEDGHWDRRLGDPEEFRGLLEQRLAACGDPDADLPLEFAPEPTTDADAQHGTDDAAEAEDPATTGATP